jgi:hypothetical protein
VQEVQECHAEPPSGMISGCRRCWMAPVPKGRDPAKLISRRAPLSFSTACAQWYAHPSNFGRSDRVKWWQFIGIILRATAIAWPIAASGQGLQPAAPAVGFLSSRAAGESADVVAAFRSGLRETGYVEGQNLTIEYRWAEGQYDRLPGLAAEMVRRPVGVLVAVGGEPSALAAKAATSERRHSP